MTDTERRWHNYRLANSSRPEARERELRHLFTLLNPQAGERVWEAGTGNGYLTFPLAEAVGRSGQVLTTDVVEANLAEVAKHNETRQLNIHTYLMHEEVPAVPEHSAFDAVASIATFHHYDNRAKGTGEQGRTAALRTFYEALRPGGRLVVADVLHGTSTQEYFDAIDHPEFCAPHGHPHDFFTKERLVELCVETGFGEVCVDAVFVPWTFSSPQEAQSFVHTIHNAAVPPEESFALAQKVLGFEKKNPHHELGWELFYLTATK